MEEFKVVLQGVEVSGARVEGGVGGGRGGPEDVVVVGEEGEEDA